MNAPIDPSLQTPIPRSLAAERLLLRCPNAADGPAINAAVIASWPDLSQWMQWTSAGMPSVGDTTARAAGQGAGFEARTELNYVAVEHTTGAVVGMFSLFDLDWTVPRAETGYWLATAKTGQGFATEGLLAVTRLGQTLGLQRIELRCSADNVRSRRLAERTGYQLEGVLRRHRRTPKGAVADTCVYARTWG